MSLPPLIPLDEAQARLLALAEPLAAEAVAVENAAGRYLAADMFAQRTQPDADLSAMDGYAVRGEELRGPWCVVGESAAGHPFERCLAQGEAIRISTGAHMPEGGGAVLIQENAIREGETLRLSGVAAATPTHIRRTGFDFAAGDVLLPKGSALGPPQIALAIASGHGELPVGKRPNLCMVDSGDELAPDPAAVAPHQIPASNGSMIAAMAAPFTAQCRRIGPVSDSMGSLIAAFEEASECQIIVTSGGASVGDHDLVYPALEQWGATIDFWRVAMKPGKPLLIASKGRQIVLGLPGNPVSAYVTAYLFLLPLLRQLAGACDPMPIRLSMRLADALPETGPRTEFIRARITPDGVHPLKQRDSSALRTLSIADGLLMRPAGAPEAAVGELVIVYPLQNGGIA